MSLDDMREVVGYAAGRCEARGVRRPHLGQRAAQVAETGVDYLAVGALTHSAPVLDIGLDMQTGRR